ncbi:MAG: glycosyltransferase [Candidatus Thiodiazotropha lotti]|nr:glycosyltransferase [Candidatus Thiodiazotropha lotti]MCG8001972.1 glycosyltransferase [Candidatus Thiodiazotropha lotti]MCG8007787.1 glycosyltransferase [Candidatus Thiodiazotropha lotti]MCW4185590.1 glycosyltransferase [Candidatus Thiodiazotropha lotti]MCW4195374.1 glycosyltransferase [Candidatus Thiodiazotropha lotti]
MAEYDFKLDLNVENNSHTQLVKRIPKGSRVLELGCATGYMSEFLRRELGCYVVGVEYDRSMAQKAKQHCDQVIVGDVQKDNWLKSLGDEPFDIITCADILEHLRDPISLLKKLPKYLKESGRLLASLPNGAHAALRLELLEGRFSYEDTGLLDRTHLHLFNYHSLRELFVRSGFRVEELSYTFHDMADSEIERRLENLGLSASDKALAMFHTPEASAFQFIVTAHPDESVSIEDFPTLTDKPMESSIEVYRNLYDQLHQTGETAATRLEMVNERDKLLQQQRDDMHALIEVRDQLLNQQQALNKTLQETQSKLLDEQAKYAELSQQYKMSERAVRSMGHEKATIEHRMDSYKQNLHDVTSSTGWRVYTKLMLPLTLFRRFKPAIGGLIKNPRMLATWFKEAKRLYKAGGLTAIRHRLTDHASPTYTYSLWIKDVEPVGLPKLESIEALNEWQGRPLISIVMPVYNVEEAWLREAIDSVLAQTYDDWELCIADDASTKSHIKRILKEYETRYKRIKVVYREENGHISAATNSALELATGQFVGLMDHDDVLAPHALFFVAQEIILHPDASVFYSDEDKLNSEEVRYDHYFKPDFNPDLMRSHNMICHFGVYRRSLLEKVGGIREGYEGAQDYDLALRCLRELDTRKEVRHIPWILYHWRAIPESTASGADAKSYAMKAAINAVKDDLENRGIEAKVTESKLIAGMIRVKYPLPEVQPLVSIIIPTRNGEALVRQCIESIKNRTEYNNYEIVIVDNQSDDPKTLEYFSQLGSVDGVKVIRYDHPFNFSAINNFAVKQTTGELLCFMNDDIEVISPGWLDEMVSQGVRSEIGAVGARLWYPDGRLQHGGVVLGLGGVAGHAMKYTYEENRGYMGRSVLVQNYTAVTAACMLVRREVFESVDGFDEENLAVAFNDVDICIRIYQQGYNNLWTPYAEFYHHESASRGAEDTPEKQRRFSGEAQYMLDKYGPLLERDPAYNPNLTRCGEDFSLNWKGVEED